MSSLPSSAEVVIVGAGPAGTAAAIALRSLGVPVLLVDRAIFPRDKVCGDVLLPEAQRSLRQLGLDTRSLERRAYICSGVRYVSPGGHEIAGEFRDSCGGSQPWWMIRRSALDAWLLEEARAVGVTVVEGTSVEGVSRSVNGQLRGVHGRRADGARYTLATKVVVGADGASSIIAREVGAFARKPEHTCIAARAYVDNINLPQPYLEVVTSAPTLPGCAWIAPVGRTTANVGIGVVLSTAGRLGSTPQALFDTMRRESPLLASRLRGCGELKLRGWTLPAATEHRAMAGEGWVLIGDAAGLVDPFTGHGIQNAIVSGMLAAEAVAAALAQGPSALRAYEERCRSSLAGEVRHGALLQRIHSSALLMRSVVAACACHAGLRNTFAALVGHSEPRHQLLSTRALARATLHLSSGSWAA